MTKTASLLALLVASPLAAQTIETVIDDQIAAFTGDDLGRAFAHAAPAIQDMFGTPEVFATMVRDHYPMVWRPDDVTFLERTEIGPNVLQRVMIRDRAGALHFLAYRMVRLGDVWRIAGVQILPGGTGL